METSGEWLWTIGPQEAQIQVHSRIAKVRSILGDVTACFAQGVLRVSPRQWATRQLVLRGIEGSQVHCRLVVLDPAGRRILQAERSDVRAAFEGQRLLRRFASGIAHQTPPRILGGEGTTTTSVFDPTAWRGDWDRRVRSGMDLDELFSWHGVDRSTGLEAAGPLRAMRLVPGRLKDLLFEASRIGMNLSMEVGLPGARLSVWKDCRDLVLAAGAFVLPGAESHLTFHSSAMDRHWVVRHQCVAGASMSVEAHDVGGSCLLRLGSEACPRIADSQAWKRLLENVYPRDPVLA